MRFASVAEVKNQLSRLLAEAKKTREPIVVTHHGKPYALIQAISERDLEELGCSSQPRERRCPPSAEAPPGCPRRTTSS